VQRKGRFEPVKATAFVNDNTTSGPSTVASLTLPVPVSTFGKVTAKTPEAALLCTISVIVASPRCLSIGQCVRRVPSGSRARGVLSGDLVWPAVDDSTREPERANHNASFQLADCARVWRIG